MKSMHRLLQRQLKRYTGSICVPPEWEKMIQAVNRAYMDFDIDRGMLERSLELSSRELLQANSELKAVIQAFPDIFLRLSRDGKVLTYKQTECSYRYPWSENLVGADFCEVVGARYAISFEEALRKIQETDAVISLEFVVNSEEIPYHYEARLVSMENDQIFVIIRDITERKQVEEQLVYYSMFDPLTNLYNRAFFEREMQRLGNKSSSPLGLIICDVDNLKMVNDTYGHVSGDRLLINVASLLRQALRKQDIVARIGGDEFAVILPNTDCAAVESTCMRIREVIIRHNDDDSQLPISISMGYSIRKLTRETMDDIFKQADDNMYKEKFMHHQMMNNDLICMVADALGNGNFIVEGTTGHSENQGTDLAIRIRCPESSWEELNLMMKLNNGVRSGPDVLLPVLQGDKQVGDYQHYLKALIILLSVVLDALPVEN